MEKANNARIREEKRIVREQVKAEKLRVREEKRVAREQVKAEKLRVREEKRVAREQVRAEKLKVKHEKWTAMKLSKNLLKLRTDMAAERPVEPESISNLEVRIENDRIKSEVRK
jgi:hypothetical protein